MPRVNDQKIVISQFVFRNCCVWESVFPVIVAVLIFSPAIWLKSTVEFADIVVFLWASQFTGIVCLQGFYFAGKCKFLEKAPFNDKYKRDRQQGGTSYSHGLHELRRA